MAAADMDTSYRALNLISICDTTGSHRIPCWDGWTEQSRVSAPNTTKHACSAHTLARTHADRHTDVSPTVSDHKYEFSHFSADHLFYFFGPSLSLHFPRNPNNDCERLFVYSENTIVFPSKSFREDFLFLDADLLFCLFVSVAKLSISFWISVVTTIAIRSVASVSQLTTHIHSLTHSHSETPYGYNQIKCYIRNFVCYETHSSAAHTEIYLQCSTDYIFVVCFFFSFSFLVQFRECENRTNHNVIFHRHFHIVVVVDFVSR